MIGWQSALHYRWEVELVSSCGLCVFPAARLAWADTRRAAELTRREWRAPMECDHTSSDVHKHNA